MTMKQAEEPSWAQNLSGLQKYDTMNMKNFRTRIEMIYYLVQEVKDSIEKLQTDFNQASETLLQDIALLEPTISDISEHETPSHTERSIPLQVVHNVTTKATRSTKNISKGKINQKRTRGSKKGIGKKPKNDRRRIAPKHLKKGVPPEEYLQTDSENAEKVEVPIQSKRTTDNTHLTLIDNGDCFCSGTHFKVYVQSISSNTLTVPGELSFPIPCASANAKLLFSIEASKNEGPVFSVCHNTAAVGPCVKENVISLLTEDKQCEISLSDDESLDKSNSIVEYLILNPVQVDYNEISRTSPLEPTNVESTSTSRASSPSKRSKSKKRKLKPRPTSQTSSKHRSLIPTVKRRVTTNPEKLKSSRVKTPPNKTNDPILENDDQTISYRGIQQIVTVQEQSTSATGGNSQPDGLNVVSEIKSETLSSSTGSNFDSPDDNERDVNMKQSETPSDDNRSSIVIKPKVCSCCDKEKCDTFNNSVTPNKDTNTSDTSKQVYLAVDSNLVTADTNMPEDNRVIATTDEPEANTKVPRNSLEDLLLKQDSSSPEPIASLVADKNNTAEKKSTNLCRPTWCRRKVVAKTLDDRENKTIKPEIVRGKQVDKTTSPLESKNASTNMPILLEEEIMERFEKEQSKKSLQEDLNIRDITTQTRIPIILPRDDKTFEFLSYPDDLVSVVSFTKIKSNAPVEPRVHRGSYLRSSIKDTSPLRLTETKPTFNEQINESKHLSAAKFVVESPRSLRSASSPKRVDEESGPSAINKSKHQKRRKSKRQQQQTNENGNTELVPNEPDQKSLFQQSLFVSQRCTESNLGNYLTAPGTSTSISGKRSDTSNSCRYKKSIPTTSGRCSSLSAGEIKCPSEISDGEVRLSHQRGINVLRPCLRGLPEVSLADEFAEDHVRIMKRKANYANWVTYYKL